MPQVRRRARFLRGAAVALVSGAVGLGLAVVPVAPATAAPSFSVSTVVSGLQYPWDITWVGSRLLYTLRAGEVWAKSGSASPDRVLDLRSQTATGSEGGLLGLVADPGAATNRVFYTCGSYREGNTRVDVRVRRWTLNSSGTSASGGTVLVSGLPLTSGRHTGCRLRFGADGKLYVGTGDAAQGNNPQNRQSLGGKVLRINPTGGAPTDNPFYGEGGNARYVWTYGHRNIQGLALRPGTSELWSAEHGSTFDDEVNRITRGGNYGWDPKPANPYTEGSNPMTDLTKFPNAVRAVWSTGSPTLATSGLTFLTGAAWGRWQGALAVGLLKDEGIDIVTVNPGGGLVRVEPLAIAERGDRIRAVQQGPDGSLYYTTSNGSNDKIVKLTPKPENPLPTYREGQDVSPVGVAAARTGTTIYAFVRSTGDRILYRRSTDDGRTWAGWTDTGVTSTSAPAVTSSASGRIDLITRSSSGTAVHTWFVGGARQGSRDLGGVITAAPAVASVSDGTIDVFVRGRTFGGSRNRYAAGSWSGWQALGGIFTSALGASANRNSGNITVAGRSTSGRSAIRTVSAGSNGAPWKSTSLLTWSGRALSDRPGAAPAVGVHVGADGNAIVDRAYQVQGVVAGYDSFPAVVSRSDGSWIMFGRASANGQLYYYDALSGGYRNVSLGGTIR